MKQVIRILGIDPGLRNTGWGVIDCKGSALHFVAAGVVTSTHKTPLASRLCELYHGLQHIIQHYQPEETAVEQVFVNVDAVGTLKLSQARSIALLVPALNGLAVNEYAPNTVKKAVIGVGHGDKQQIQMMVKMLLPKAHFPASDAADALALSICHAHYRRQKNLLDRKVAVA